jgi:rhodanese-related sulfurtransferase
MRSANVVGQLQKMGYINASYVNGGMSLWARQAWPMVKP